MRILAGDIGGTHTRLVYVQDDCDPSIRHERSYASADYMGLIEVIEAFLSHYDIQKPLDAACLAVAGPVISGYASLTNLPWQVGESELSSRLQTAHVSLINDLVAVAYAIPGLQDDDVFVVQPGKSCAGPEAIFDAVVIGAGTGLGAAHLVWQGDHYHALSSEAGHVGFAPETVMQEQLLSWLHRQHAHVSVEMLLSGCGIYTLYQFFRDELGLSESSLIREAMQNTDPARVISEHAVIGDDVLCTQTLASFIEIYAAVAGDIVLHHYPVSAVYLAGGIGPKLQSLLACSASSFSEAFTNKGPMRGNLQKLPVKLIMDNSPGLDGAIVYARQQYLSE